MRYPLAFPCPVDGCTAEATVTEAGRLATLPGCCPSTGAPYTRAHLTTALATVRAIVDDYDADATSILAPPCIGGPLCTCLH